MASKKKIESDLRAALFGERPLSIDLYEQELDAYENELRESLSEDADDALLCIFTDGGEVAMMLIEQNGTIHRNQHALEKLKAMWPQSFDANFQTLLPMLAADISQGSLGVLGVKFLPA